ncbi:MAG: hypothetical protein LBI79_03590, partial [Nitrososphaerota archaeon]|nr:hypothetical protein [Nitrososphaerota archaeon]
MDRNIKKFKFKLSNFRTSLLFVSLLFVLLFSSTPCVLTAQGAEFNVVSVKDPDMLRSAVSTAAESGVPVVIVLENDITLTETALTISHNADVTLTSNNALVRENGVEFFRLIGVTDANTILVDDRGVLRLEGVIDVLGHIEGEKVITLEATCTAEGAWEISCIVCDELL